MDTLNSVINKRQIVVNKRQERNECYLRSREIILLAYHGDSLHARRPKMPDATAKGGEL